MSWTSCCKRILAVFAICVAITGCSEETKPLLQVVSGAAAKQRPSNALFAAKQQINNPELRSLFSRGMVWGFAHVTLDGEHATVKLISTPNDSGGRIVEEFEIILARRSAGPPPSREP